MIPSNPKNKYVEIFSDIFRKNFSADEVSKERMAICKSCENLTKLDFCKMCGCQMNIKTKLARMSCPIDKWKEV